MTRSRKLMLKLLHDREQVDSARRSLRARGLDTSVGWRRRLFQLLYSIRFRRLPPPVAINKSWDVLTMIEAIESGHPTRDARILDMGSSNCEIPLALWRLGYRSIRAADLNPIGRSINWYLNGIDFHCEDFYNPAIEPASLDVMTALSVIEHGYDQNRLIDVALRLLKPNGILCLTTDFHDPKIEIAADFKLFGLPYRIFDRAEVEGLIEAASTRGLKPLGSLDWTESAYPIEWIGYKMTFVFLALVKRTD